MTIKEYSCNQITVSSVRNKSLLIRDLITSFFYEFSFVFDRITIDAVIYVQCNDILVLIFCMTSFYFTIIKQKNVGSLTLHSHVLIICNEYIYKQNTSIYLTLWQKKKNTSKIQNKQINKRTKQTLRYRYVYKTKHLFLKHACIMFVSIDINSETNNYFL